MSEFGYGNFQVGGNVNVDDIDELVEAINEDLGSKKINREDICKAFYNGEHFSVGQNMNYGMCADAMEYCEKKGICYRQYSDGIGEYLPSIKIFDGIVAKQTDCNTDQVPVMNLVAMENYLSARKTLEYAINILNAVGEYEVPKLTIINDKKK